MGQQQCILMPSEANALEKRRQLICDCVLGNNKCYYGINIKETECMTPELLDPNTPDAQVCAIIHGIAVDRYKRSTENNNDAENVESEPHEEKKTLYMIISYPASRSDEVKASAMALKQLCTTFSVRKA